MLISIAIGGALGAMLRYGCVNLTTAFLGRDFPYGTLLVNILGSFFIGFLSILLVERLVVSNELKTAILTGFLGAFTTFSTFSLDALSLINAGEIFKSLAYILLSVCSCIIAVYLGILLARQ